ncbi:hypothetical protein EMCRGX_G031165 [Ephydatia muelleri]
MAAVVGNIEQDVDVALARTELNSAVPGSHSLGATELVSFCGETETASLLESTAAASAAEVVREKRLVKLQSSSNLWASGTNEKELKANMYIHLSNPLQRWRTDRILPWKMILQGVKALLVLAQAFLLTASPFDYRVYIMPETQDVFTNLLVNSPNDPISRYTFYAYSIDDVLEELQFSSDQFYNLKNITLAGYDYVKAENGSIIPIQVILTQYNLVELNTSERTFTLGGTYNDVSFWLQPSTQSQKSIVDQFLNASQDPDFARFVKMDVLFQVNHLRVVPPTMVLCYVISIKMHYQAVGGGIVQYSLSANPEYVSCNKRVAVNQSGDISVKLRLLTVLDGAVLIICTVSLISTGVVMFKSYKLAKAMGIFYHTHLNIELSWRERLPLFSNWHAFSILSDLFFVAGTVAKIASSYDYSSSLIAVKVLLGIGITLQSAVMLRYISYFEQLNALTRALSVAFPPLVKFITCVGILFLAYALCGWVILSPYHNKFTYFHEVLYSLLTSMNGDDLYTDYVAMPSQNKAVYVTGVLFFTTFIMLFFYSVRNLALSLIIHAHQESHVQEESVIDEVNLFIYSGPLTPSGVSLREIAGAKKFVDPDVIRNRKPHYGHRYGTVS